jgi:uncharacterized phage-associated protein
MAFHSPLAIANEFLDLHGTTSIPAQMQLQKLVHIANGWNLAINGEPLVSELPQAWDNGPVFRSIWNHIRDCGFGRKSNLLENPTSSKPYRAPLSDSERTIIDHVWRKYRHLSGLELSRLTHEPNTPWSKAYFERGRNSSIPNEDVKRHYTELALKGRAAA